MSEARAENFEIVEINDFLYVRATGWKAVGWWTAGALMLKSKALLLLESHGITFP